MGKKWRLIIDSPASARWNMAADEFLLMQQYNHPGNPVLRIYSWEKPAISLGYMQDARVIDADHAELPNIDVVRRITGGGAVLHGGDLTYSIAAPIGEEIPCDLLASYRYLCQGVIHGLALLGIRTDLGHEMPGKTRSYSCFASIAPGDLQWQGYKIAGSAQCRKGNALLQHGSIPVQNEAVILNQCGAHPVLEKHVLTGRGMSLEQALGRELDIDAAAMAMVEGFRQALHLEFEIRGWTHEERALIYQYSGVL